VSGGGGVLTAQSLCPFKAFARYRLAARALEVPEPGLTALELGELIHAVLEEFWKKYLSSAQLAGLGEQNRKSEVAKIASLVVEKAANGAKKHRFTRSSQQMITDHLTVLIDSWLQFEKEQRLPFTVKEQEESKSIVVGGLKLQVRMDRVDQLVAGGKIIIDYKSGNATTTDWFGERPRSPQLPLYSLGDGAADVDAVAFAKVGRKNRSFAGVAKVENVLPALKPWSKFPDTKKEATWDELFGEWEKVLNKLGSSFRTGEAVPDPLKQACDLCDLLELCRYHESGGDDDLSN